MDDRDPIDRLLDSALDSYAQPPDALESRILTALAEERMHRTNTFRRYLHPWGIAVAAAAVLLLSFVLWPSQKHAPDMQIAREPGLVNPPQATQRTSAAPHLAEHRIAVRSARHQPATSRKLPKLDIFPTPQPPTPTEEALALYVAHASPADRQALIESQQKQNEPIHIAAIEIAPLDPSTSHGN